MIFRPQLFSPLLSSVLVLLAVLTLRSESQARGKPPPPPPHPHARAMPKPPLAAANPNLAALQTAERDLVQAQVLRQVLVVLAAANHDYDGHKANAMHAVTAAIKVLDGNVMKHGAPQHKAATVQANAAVASARQADKNNPQEHQSASDAQLRQTGVVLLQLRPVLAQNKQQKVLGHVDKAITELTIALKIR